MQKSEQSIFNETYSLELDLKVRKPAELDILIPVHNSLNLVQVCVECIRKFSTVDYRMIVIDDASELETKEWLKSQKDLDLIFNTAGTPAHKTKEWWKVPFGGSTSNAIQLEIGSRYVTAPNVFVMHSDALPCQKGWDATFLSKLSDQVKGVSIRKDPGRISAMHISGLLFQNLFNELKLTFEHQMPTYDAGDGITKSLRTEGYECHFFRNTFNNPELLDLPVFKNHWLSEIYCDRALDDSALPFYLHLGRGTLQTSGPGNISRKTTHTQWCEAIRKNLLN